MRGQVDVEVNWQPFFLNPNFKGRVPIGQYLQQKYGMSEAQLKSPQNPLKQAGRRAGIEFTDDRLVVDTLASHCLVEHAQGRGKGDAVIEELFQAYFERGEDISDLGILVGIADKHQISGAREAMGSTALQEQVRTKAQQWQSQHRITGVPYFVIKGAEGKRPVALSGGQPPDAFTEVFQQVL